MENKDCPLKPVQFDYDLWRLLSDTHRLISHASGKQLRTYGLSHEIAAHLSAIYLLGDNVMPIDLARVMRRKPQTITGIIQRMELKGLVVKNQDEFKKNIFRISLSEKGLNAFRKASQIDVYSKVLRGLSEEKRKIFVECLYELKTIAQKYW